VTGPVGFEPEHREEHPLFGPAERDRTVVDADLEGSQDANLHDGSLDQHSHTLSARGLSPV